MPYNKDNSILFIHIPKVAGTSVIKMFNMDENCGHVTSDYHKNNNPVFFKNAFKFAIIRNPWDKFVSCYEYSKMDSSYWHSSDGNAKYGIHVDYNITTKYNFNDFVKYIKNESEIPLKSVNWSEQYKFILDKNDDVLVDVIYRYEHLDFMVNDLNDKHNLNYNLPKINTSIRNDYKTYYNDESIEFVNNLYKKDVDLFNFKF